MESSHCWNASNFSLNKHLHKHQPDPIAEFWPYLCIPKSKISIHGSSHHWPSPCNNASLPKTALALTTIAWSISFLEGTGWEEPLLLWVCIRITNALGSYAVYTILHHLLLCHLHHVNVPLHCCHLHWKPQLHCCLHWLPQHHKHLHQLLLHQYPLL